MKTLFEEKKTNSIVIEQPSLKFDGKQILEYFSTENVSEYIKAVDQLNPPDFTGLLEQVRQYKKLNTIQSINEGTVNQIQNIRYEIRNGINFTIEFKDKFNDFKQSWKEISYLLKRMYERNKDTFLVDEEIKTLKNESARISEINVRQRPLIDCIDKLEVYLMRFKQIDDELRETLAYLQDLQNENSRVQSAVQLALDTGELDKIYWKD